MNELKRAYEELNMEYFKHNESATDNKIFIKETMKYYAANSLYKEWLIYDNFRKDLISYAKAQWL